LQALSTSSYRDVIENAGYRVIAQTGDTSMIDTVDARVGQDHFASHVLAALAARGNARALDLLTKHLDDDRPAARRWALEAFRFSLPRALAQAKLQAVGATLTHADAKQAVEDLLQQWHHEGT
jgi:hypothetical protein